MKRPTEDDLKMAIPELAFEFYHFQFYAQLVQLYSEGRGPIKDVGIYQAIGYGLLIHLRSLLDFFYKQTGHDDDIVVSDFCILAGFSWSRDEPSDSIRKLLFNLNKRLAHITSARWRDNRPDMAYYRQQVPEIATRINRFRDALPPELQMSLSTIINGYASGDSALLSKDT